MRTVEVEGVGQVTLRDANDLTVRQRRPIEILAMRLGPIMKALEALREDPESIDDLNLSEEHAALVFDLQDATICASVAAWPLDQPLPTRDTVGDLPGHVYDALAKATAALATDAAPVDFSPTVTEESPTGSSEPSDGRGAPQAAPAS